VSIALAHNTECKLVLVRRTDAAFLTIAKSLNGYNVAWPLMRPPRSHTTGLPPGLLANQSYKAGMHRSCALPFYLPTKFANSLDRAITLILKKNTEKQEN
jgi:hypothetical protein